jgi:hypothetical protein
MNLVDEPGTRQQSEGGIYRVVAKMADFAGQLAPPRATSAAESALGLRPRIALFSARPSPEWTTDTAPRKNFSSNGAYLP